MTLLVPLVLALVVVVVAGNSLRRKGRWSQRTYVLWVIAASALCLVTAALAFYPRALDR